MSAKVNVCMIAKNRENAITVTIKSLLEQSFDDFKVLACDGMSQDKTMNVLFDMQNSSNGKLLAYQTPKEGYINSLNHILSKVDSDYFCFIDSDDFISKNKLEEQVKFLEENPDVDVVSSAMMLSDKRILANSIVNLSNEQIDTYLKTNAPINTVCHFQSCLFRRRVLEKFNSRKFFYDEYNTGRAGDGFLYTLYFLGYKFANINNVFYIYSKGVLENSMSKNIEPEFANNIDSLSFENKKKEILNLFNKYNPQVVEKKKRGRPKKVETTKVTE